VPYKTTISVSANTHERLKRIGYYGETMNDIVVRLLDAYHECCVLHRGGKPKLKSVL